jgi:hypothetical protein
MPTLRGRLTTPLQDFGHCSVAKIRAEDGPLKAK